MKNLTLFSGFDSVYAGFRPHDMGVTVEFAGRRYHPEWRLVSEMPIERDRVGPPEYWCSDGITVYFDKCANGDYAVEIEPQVALVQPAGFLARLIARIRKA